MQNTLYLDYEGNKQNNVISKQRLECKYNRYKIGLVHKKARSTLAETGKLLRMLMTLNRSTAMDGHCNKRTVSRGTSMLKVKGDPVLEGK